MAFAQYLAMTAAEMMGNAPPAEGVAWMACHFSPYSTGLCNLPHALPPGSLLILNDRTPIHGHDASRVCRELSQALNMPVGTLPYLPRPYPPTPPFPSIWSNGPGNPYGWRPLWRGRPSPWAQMEPHLAAIPGL